jgi:2-polyprenyl-6-hydroxyphenyl methylase/3-demethylubiquinone-9 3-methyltransferase
VISEPGNHARAIGPETIDGLAVATSPAGGALATARAGFRGVLPPRYRSDTWDRRFRIEVAAALAAGSDVLDVGAGARPVVARDERPAGCTYVGLDRSATELAKAPSGSYDRAVVADVTLDRPGLHSSFDLILSWMVLEHVESLPAALANLRAYARPGARLIAQLPGAFSLASLANRVVPAPVKRLFLRRIQGRGPGEVFPAHYDRCWHSALVRLLAVGWETPRVLSLYTGAFYVSFSPMLRAGYLAYEEAISGRGLANLAPYYLITARAPDR